MAQARSARAINSVRNFQYGPRTRLVRGIHWQDPKSLGRLNKQRRQLQRGRDEQGQ